jgi:hypothetical protein
LTALAAGPSRTPRPPQDFTARDRLRRVAKVVLWLVVLPLVLAALVVMVLATTPWGNERVRGIVVSQANQRLTGRLQVAGLRGNLLSGATLTDVQLRDSMGKPVFTARRVQVRYRLWSWLRGRVVVKSLVLDTALVVADKQPGARWNFQALMRPSGAREDTSRRGVPPEITDVTIRHGRFVYRRPWKPDSTLPADKRDAAIASALGATARNRTVRVPGGFQRVLEYHHIDARIPVVALANEGHPASIRIGALSMIGEPYRPPVIDVRSLTGTIYASKDSLWWHGARLALPASRLSGDGRLGFNRSGIVMSVAGAPLALADLRWLNPKLPAEGGGRLRLTMRSHGDTSEYALADADIRYRDASIAGAASFVRVAPRGRKSTMLVRGADVTVAHLSTSLLKELLPSVTLPRAGVIDGHLALSGAPSALHVNADVRFDDARAGMSHLLARGGVGIEGGFRARNLDVQLRPLRMATLGSRVPLGGTVTGSALVSGAQREGWNVRGDLTHRQGTERSRVVGSGRYQTVGGRIVAAATLRPLSLATVGRFAPSAQLRGSVVGRVHAEGTTRDLRVSGVLRSTSGGGGFEGRGAVALAGSRTRYDVSIALDALDASVFSRRAPHTRLTGAVVARGQGISLTTSNALVRVDLVRSRYDTFGVDRVVARLAASNGVLRADTLVVIADGAEARASGTLGLVAGRDGTMRATVTVDSLGALRRWLGTADTSRVAASSGRQGARLAAARADSARRAGARRIERLALGLPTDDLLILDTLPAIRRDSLAGSLSAVATLRGNVKRVGVEASVRGSDLVVHGNAVRTLSANVSSANLRDRSLPLAFRVDAYEVQASGYGFEHMNAQGIWRDERLSGSAEIRQDAHVSYAALGSWERPASGVQRVRLDSLAARFDTLVWRLAHAGGVALDHGAVAVDSIDLRSSAGGRLFANGAVPKEGNVRLDVAAENVRASTVLRALQRDAAGDGVIAAAAQIGGTRAAPTISGRARLRDAVYGDTRAPDAEVDLRYANRRLALEGNARDSSGRQVLAATASLPIDLSLQKVAGSRRIAGPITVDVVVDSLNLAALPLSSRSLVGVRGRTAGEVQVRGTWKAPSYSGHAAVRDAGLTLVATGMRLSDGVADLRLVGDTLHLDSLVARAKGTIRASGSVDLADRSRPFVRMTAEGRNLRVMDATRGLVDADGEIEAVGPLDAVRVTGRAEMLHGFLALKQFRKDLLRVKAPGDLAFFAVYDTTRPATDSARRLGALGKKRRVGVIADLSLVVDRGNYYRNRPDANTEFYTGDGEEVRAHLDTRSSDQWAVGFVRIGEGVAIFRASAFVPARGTLTFSSYTNGPGFVEQVGERPVWEPGRGFFPLQLLTGGTSKAPAVGLESGSLFPIRGRELNGYLTIGRSRSSLLQQSGSSLSGSEAWSGQLSGETGALARRQQAATALGVVLHDIGTGATKEFGLDAFSVSPADVPTELVFGKTGGVRGAMIEGGRYLTVDRYVAGQMRMTTGIPGARMSQLFSNAYRLDIALEPRFLFRNPDDLGITHPTVRTGVFGAFLTRMWDW